MRNALNHNGVVLLLFLIGGAGVIAELQTPGVGLGGMIAFLCFLLFFWGKFLDGTSGWLEVLLFAFGLMFLLIELFVLPGFGIFGFGGGLMMIASLVLASQTFIIPQNTYQVNQLRNTLVTLALSGVGIVGAAVVLKRYLPSAPGFNRMLLKPPTELERELIARRESLADFGDLVGREGKTATKLTPSGKALIDDRLIDVVAPGDYVESGAAIKVVEVRGSRVVVRRIE
ncbi:MAG: NfeD family protein [Pirellulales bacterium]